MKKGFAVLLIATMLIVFAGCGDSSGGDADTIIIKAGHVEVEEKAIHQSLLKFAEYVSEQTDGAVEVQAYANGELGDDSTLLESVGLGTIQMTIPNSAVFTSYAEKFAVLNLPYLFDSQEKMEGAITGDLGNLFAGWMEEYGFKCLGFQYDGARCMSNNKTPIYTPADMKGLKMRVMDSELYIEMFTLMGANATPMSYNEVYTALQQGVVDGQDNPPGLTYGSKFNEVLQYFSTTKHVYSNCPVVINKAFFEGLEPEYQKVIEEGAQLYLETWQREEETALEQDYIDLIAKSGVAVNELDEAGLSAFKESVQPLYDKYRSKLGDDIMDQVLELAQ